MSLLESLKSLVTPDILSRASQLLGEDEGKISKGLAAGLPAALLSAGQHTPDSPALKNAFDILANVPLDEDPVKAAAGQDAGTFLPDFLKNILGDKADAITRVINEVSGAKGGGILALVGGLLMQFLGGKVKLEGLNPAGLVEMVGKEKGALLAALPAGLANVFDGVNLPKVTTPSVAAPLMVEPERSVTKSATRWVPLALLGILAVGGFAIRATWNSEAAHHGEEKGSHSTSKDSHAEPHNNAAAVTEPASGAGMGVAEASLKNPVEGQPGMVALSIPGGSDVIGAETGIEAQLVDFIMSEKPIDEKTWFNFDRLTFDTGKATLKAESKPQLENMVKILRAFPSVKLKIGGYTDNVGDQAANQKLSAERATNVMVEIAKMGIAPDRLEAEGYGMEHPVASNDTEEGRAQNRRIAARIIEK